MRSSRLGRLGRLGRLLCRLAAASAACIALASSCNMPQPPIPKKLGLAAPPAAAAVPAGLSVDAFVVSQRGRPAIPLQGLRSD